jgi:hypothetical protein
MIMRREPNNLIYTFSAFSLLRGFVYVNAVRARSLYKPFRCRYANTTGDTLVQDVVECLSQVLAGLPYILEAKTSIRDDDDDKREIDVLVRDRRSKLVYAIIECKNISSAAPSTYDTQLARAHRHLSAFTSDNALLKFCIVRKKSKIRKRIDNEFKRIGVTIYEWSDPVDWLRMAIRIRLTILAWYDWKEDMETYTKLIYYYERHVDKKKTGYVDRVNFLITLGYPASQARNAIYRIQKSAVDQK